MAIEVIVIDDEALARKRLTRLLTEMSVTVVAEGCDGLEAIALIRKYKVDMLFMDINMPNKNGLESAQEITRMYDNPPSIVFCTAYDEYAIEAFKTHATAYLLKPISHDDVRDVLSNIEKINRMQLSAIENLNNATQSLQTISIGSGQSLEKMFVSEVVYFQSKGKYCYAHHIEKGDVLVDYTLKELASKLESTFIRSHRSSLINKEYIEKLDKDDNGKIALYLRPTGSIVPVSRRHLSQIKKCFDL